MIRNPFTLKQLIDLCEQGYATDVFKVSRDKANLISKVKVAGFRQSKNRQYLWYEDKKWLPAKECIGKIREYFVVDCGSYKNIVGKKCKSERKSDALEAYRISEERGCILKDDCASSIDVRVYQDIDKKKSKHNMRIALEDFITKTGVKVIASNFSFFDDLARADTIITTSNSIESFVMRGVKESVHDIEKIIADYKKFSDKVWIVINKNRLELVSDYLDNVGIITYAHGEIEVIKNAERNIPDGNLIDALWDIELSKILIGLGIPREEWGNKKETIDRLCLHSVHRTNKIATYIMMSRITNAYNGKHMQNKTMELKDCAGTIPLTALRRIVYGNNEASKLLKEVESKNSTNSECTLQY